MTNEHSDNNILRGHGRKFYQEYSRQYAKNEPVKIDIVKKSTSKKSTPPQADLELIRWIFELKENLGSEGSNFIFEVIKTGIGPKEIRNPKNTAALTEIIYNRTNPQIESTTTHIRGKKFLGITIGEEHKTTVHIPYQPPVIPDNPITIERTTLGQRIIKRILKR